MVSLWPWKGDDNSPASFEKALSALSTKISKSQAQLDLLRQRHRRYKALWTLYTSFAYLLCFVIMFLVVGWKNWGAVEYSALAGSPVAIYLIRHLIIIYYDYRVDTVTQRLEDHQAERTKTIEKLKAATKYNSTQELLEKYGGAPPKPKKPAAPKTPKSNAGPKPVEGRTSMGPPATANIPRPGQVPSQPPTPVQQAQMSPPQLPHLIPSPAPSRPQTATAEFAPNAFPPQPQYAQTAEVNVGGNWYDRVLDLLMGEDETAPKNRFVLICQNCRLVNGQAPPGTKSLADLGKWKCYGCGRINGEEDEAAKVVKEIKQRIEVQDSDSLSAKEEAKAVGDEKELEVEESDTKDNEGSEDEKADEADESSGMVEVEAKPKKKTKNHKKKN